MTTCLQIMSKLKLSLAHATDSVRNKFNKLRNESIESGRLLEEKYKPITKRLGLLLDSNVEKKIPPPPPLTHKAKKNAATRFTKKIIKNKPPPRVTHFRNDDDASLLNDQQLNHLPQQPSTNREAYDDNSVDMISVLGNKDADNNDDDNEHADDGNETTAEELVRKKNPHRYTPYSYATKGRNGNAASKRDAQMKKQMEHEIRSLRRSQRLININRQQPHAQFDDDIFYPLPAASDSHLVSDDDDDNYSNKRKRANSELNANARTQEEIKRRQREPKYKLVSLARSERKRKACSKSKAETALGEPRSKMTKKNVEKKAAVAAEKVKYKLISSNRLERKRKPNEKVRPCGEPQNKKQFMPRAQQPIKRITRSSGRRLSTKNVLGEGIVDLTTKQFHNHAATGANTLTYWDDANELVDRLRLLVSSTSAGHTGHSNEIISIIEELREANLIE